jgi:hypothetical protein
MVKFFAHKHFFRKERAMKDVVISLSSAARFPIQSRLIAAASLLLCAGAPVTAVAQSPCPAPGQVPINPRPYLTAPAATLVPNDACIPGGFSPKKIPIAYFDHYAWRAFIALVWPASSGARGVADQNRKLEQVGQSDVTSVFETFKADWETFQPGGVEPSPWNSHQAVMTSDPALMPCRNAVPGDFLLASVGKFGSSGNIGEAGVNSLISVLVSQNGRLVRYLAAYNRKEFDKIRAKRLFLQENIENTDISFDIGSLSVKSSWIDLTNIANPERFHKREAWLVDPMSGACNKVMVGLVGLHIVQKTPTRPQWIWATFEHVDNVPPPGYVAPEKPTTTFTFNDGASMPMPRRIPHDYSFGTAITQPAPPAPINVQRLMPINSNIDVSQNTTETNFMWRRALQTEKSVWQYYQLVMTQWPTSASHPKESGKPGFTTPGLGSSNLHSAFANTTLETWHQTNVNTGCMSCHAIVQNDNDFVWSLQMNAYSATHVRSSSPALKALQNLLREP